jgi:hypothetical protein
MFQKERSARSKLAKLVHNSQMLRGSLVTMSRVCGKEKCRCTQGQKHVSLYLSMRIGKKRKMIYVPSSMEKTVQNWVSNYQEIECLLEETSQACLNRFQREKEDLKEEL